MKKSNKKTVIYGKFGKEDSAKNDKPKFFSDWLKKAIEDKKKLSDFMPYHLQYDNSKEKS